MNGIGWAVAEMEHGARVQRANWNGAHQWIALQRPDVQSRMSLPYIYMKTADEHIVPWMCSQADLLAKDWQLYCAPPPERAMSA